MRPNVAATFLGLTALLMAGCGTAPLQSRPAGNPAAANRTTATALPPPLRALGTLPAVGQPAPELSVVDLAGNPVTLEDKRGFGVIVTFFTTWCPTCQQELPVLARKRGECGCLGLDVLAVNAVDERPEKLQEFKEKYDVRMPLYRDADSVNTGRWGIRAVPTSFFIDRRSRVRAVRTGHVPETELDKLIQEILEFGR